MLCEQPCQHDHIIVPTSSPQSKATGRSQASFRPVHTGFAQRHAKELRGSTGRHEREIGDGSGNELVIALLGEPASSGSPGTIHLVKSAHFAPQLTSALSTPMRPKRARSLGVCR